MIRSFFLSVATIGGGFASIEAQPVVPTHELAFDRTLHTPLAPPQAPRRVRTQDPLTAYYKIPRTCMPWQTPIGKAGGNCGHNEPVLCNLTLLAEVCSSTFGCNAFNSNGFMASCAGGRCDCDSGFENCLRGLDIFNTNTSEANMYGCDTADLWILRGFDVPPEWITEVESGKILWGSPEARECYMPEIGNGYVGTSITWGAVYISGFFNGPCGTVGKARIPSPVAVTLVDPVGKTHVASGDEVDVTSTTVTTTTTLMGGALDTINGVYRRRWLVTTDAGVVVQVEQRWYAHRVRRNIVVMEIAPLEPVTEGDSLSISYTSLWAPTPTGLIPADGHVPGDNCAGGLPTDLDFLSNTTVSSPSYMIANARTNSKADHGELFNLTIVVELYEPNGTFTFSGSGVTPAPLTFLSAFGTTLDTVAAGGNGDTDTVQAYTLSVFQDALGVGGAQLYTEHSTAWNALNLAGIDITPLDPLDEGDVARALDIAQHAASSQYYLFSSVRDDWSTGISPGGISSGSYQGAVFMDMDVWMLPALYFLAPSLAESVVEFRYVSVASGTEEAIATLFGYNGSMTAWTAGYQGRLFGCCSGHGGYEDCLEQHVNGAKAWAAWQYYAITGNETWLQTKGWPILEGAAEFHMSRVTDNGNGTYSIKGILPIDEWCVDSGCGCEEPGVNDDAQMNAVSKLSLLKAAQAAQILSIQTPRTQQYEVVGNGVVILFNETNAHHNQFNSPTCPGGWGGTHYTSRHTVCPEDVMLLTYPWGDALNVSTAVSQKDAEVFIPITCQENAGMTTPIHTIVWLQLGQQALAMAEFNRSMHGAAYGPFCVRNEVDMHTDIVGGTFNNSHFLTGDGGFLQSLLSGFGGMRILDNIMKILRPSLPDSVGSMTLRAIVWHGYTFSWAVGRVNATFTVGSNNANGFAIYDGWGQNCRVIAPGQEWNLTISSFTWPAYLTEQCE